MQLHTRYPLRDAITSSRRRTKKKKNQGRATPQRHSNAIFARGRYRASQQETYAAPPNKKHMQLLPARGMRHRQQLGPPLKRGPRISLSKHRLPKKVTLINVIHLSALYYASLWVNLRDNLLLRGHIPINNKAVSSLGNQTALFLWIYTKIQASKDTAWPHCVMSSKTQQNYVPSIPVMPNGSRPD